MTVNQFFISVLNKIKKYWQGIFGKSGESQLPEKKMQEISNLSSDFVAIANDRVWVRGRKDNFSAVKYKGVWAIGAPEFDDIMDNFSDLKDLILVEQYSKEARSTQTVMNPSLN